MGRVLKLAAAYILYFVAAVALITGIVWINKSTNSGAFFTGKEGEVRANPVMQNEERTEKSQAKLTKRIRNNAVQDDGEKYIILTFDDGWESQYTAYKLLKPFKGTLYICSALIGQADRLRVEQLKEMYNSGWDICNHTVNHTNLTKVDPETAFAEVQECSIWIENNGFIRNRGYKHFAFPEGGYDQGIIGILEKQGILSARTTKAGSDTTDFLQLGRMSLHGMTIKNIRDNILSDKKMLILSFHRIVSDDTIELKDIDLKESYFREVITSIKASGRTVVTLTEWYEMQSAGME